MSKFIYKGTLNEKYISGTILSDNIEANKVSVNTLDSTREDINILKNVDIDGDLSVSGDLNASIINGPLNINNEFDSQELTKSVFKIDNHDDNITDNILNIKQNKDVVFNGSDVSGCANLTVNNQITTQNLKNSNDAFTNNLYVSGSDSTDAKVKITGSSQTLDIKTSSGNGTFNYNGKIIGPSYETNNYVVSKNGNDGIRLNGSSKTIQTTTDGSTWNNISFGQGSEIGKNGSGTNAEIFNDYSNNTSSGDYSHSEGNNTKATGTYSHSEGHGTTASGISSHAEGENSIASGKYSHAECRGTSSPGNYSHCEGWESISFGENSHSEGYKTRAVGTNSHSEGKETVAGGYKKAASSSTASDYSGGNHAHAEGWSTIAYGQASHAEGKNTMTCQRLGSGTDADPFTYSGGNYAHAEGTSTIASGEGSHAEGTTTTASGNYSHAEGQGTNENVSSITVKGTSYTINKKYGTAAGNYGSHCEGYNNIAFSNCSHAEGVLNISYGADSHVEGGECYSIGKRSHAEGNQTAAVGINSHSEGNNTIASGNYSHAAGSYTIASQANETVVGTYNVDDTGTTTYKLFVVGNGTNNNNRSDAFTVYNNGFATLNGDLFLNSNVIKIGKSPCQFLTYAKQDYTSNESFTRPIDNEDYNYVITGNIINISANLRPNYKFISAYRSKNNLANDYANEFIFNIDLSTIKTYLDDVYGASSSTFGFVGGSCVFDINNIGNFYYKYYTSPSANLTDQYSTGLVFYIVGLEGSGKFSGDYSEYYISHFNGLTNYNTFNAQLLYIKLY